MKNMNHQKVGSAFSLLVAIATLALLCCFAVLPVSAAPPAPNASASQADEFQPSSIAGLGIVVRTKFGGTILGFDIDANGAEGLLSEYVSEGGGNNLVATEAFDQKTGKIVKVVLKKDQTQDDYVTLGIVGSHVGLVENEKAIGGKIKRIFRTVDPLSSNKFTGRWTPHIKTGYLLGAISHTQGSPNIAAYQFKNDGSGTLSVFSSDVGANTFGPQVLFTDNNIGNFPVLAFDSKTNQAVLAGSIGCPTCLPTIAMINLATGKTREFGGVGFGSVNGLALDPKTGVACTTSEVDFSVEFYDLTKGTGFKETLPNAVSEEQTGADVEFDPIHKLFFVAQPVTSSGVSGSTIYVYDEKGNLKETLNGFKIPVSPTLIALKPSKRTGFVFVDNFASGLQAFTY